MRKSEIALRIVGLALTATGIVVSAIVDIYKHTKLSQSDMDYIAEKTAEHLESKLKNK